MKKISHNVLPILSKLFSVLIISLMVFGCGPTYVVQNTPAPPPPPPPAPEPQYVVPEWAPDYDSNSGVRYYYIPDMEAYYDVWTGQYVYMYGGGWVHTTYLPPAYSNYDMHSSFVVVLNAQTQQPWTQHEVYARQYPHNYYRNAYGEGNRPRGFNENTKGAVYTNYSAKNHPASAGGHPVNGQQNHMNNGQEQNRYNSNENRTQEQNHMNNGQEQNRYNSNENRSEETNHLNNNGQSNTHKEGTQNENRSEQGQLNHNTNETRSTNGNQTNASGQTNAQRGGQVENRNNTQANGTNKPGTNANAVKPGTQNNPNSKNNTKTPPKTQTPQKTNKPEPKQEGK